MSLRTYTVTASTGHYKATVYCSIPGERWIETWRSSSRIRQFVIVAFRKYFGGREPNFHWHKDGFMAEASDARGNHICVEQTNWWHQFAQGATKMPKPLAPMIVKPRMLC